jgi:hypothetical protein
LAVGESLNRLNDLIEAHVAVEVKKEFKRALGEAMVGVGTTLLMPIIRLYPDLDPDR